MSEQQALQHQALQHQTQDTCVTAPVVGGAHQRGPGVETGNRPPPGRASSDRRVTRLLETLAPCKTRADLARAYRVTRAIARTFEGGDWRAAVGAFKQRAKELGLPWRGI